MALARSYEAFVAMRATLTTAAWFNATQVAAKRGRDINKFLSRLDVVEYMVELHDSDSDPMSCMEQDFNKIKELSASPRRVALLALAKKTGLVKTHAWRCQADTPIDNLGKLGIEALAHRVVFRIGGDLRISRGVSEARDSGHGRQHYGHRRALCFGIFQSYPQARFLLANPFVDFQVTRRRAA